MQEVTSLWSVWVLSMVLQDCTSSIMCHVEAMRQKIVFELLPGEVMSFSGNMTFDSSFLPTTRSRVPIVEAELSIFCQSVGHVVGIPEKMAHLFRLVPRGQGDKNLSYRRCDA